MLRSVSASAFQVKPALLNPVRDKAREGKARDKVVHGPNKGRILATKVIGLQVLAHVATIAIATTQTSGHLTRRHGLRVRAKQRSVKLRLYRSLPSKTRNKYKSKSRRRWLNSAVAVVVTRATGLSTVGISGLV